MISLDDFMRLARRAREDGQAGFVERALGTPYRTCAQLKILRRGGPGQANKTAPVPKAYAYCADPINRA
jgi:hypothetical protein